MAQNYVKRVTLFKVPKPEDIDQVLQAYEVLKQNAKRNGEPYVVSNAARKVLNTSSPLSEGYTIMSQSIFKNHSDHDFYDRECTAHKKLKACCSQHRRFWKSSDLLSQETTSKVRTGVMTIVTEGAWPEPKL